jgi:hypothetical protein
MYVRVPESIEEHLLRELQRTRVRSIIKLLPVLILILAIALPLIVFLKGLHFIKAILEMASIETTDLRIFIATFVLCFAPAMLILYFTLRGAIKECVCHEYLYCEPCNAVDRYDEGKCPLCQTALRTKYRFFYTTDKQESKILTKWGLQPVKQSSARDV